MRQEVFALLLLGFASSLNAAAIYKWVDENGITHFGPEPQSSNASRIRLQGLNSFAGTPTTKDTSTTATKATPPPEIVMYGASWCGICKKARNYFNANNVRYTEYDIEKNTKAKREYDKLNGSGVPLFQVDGQTVRGFSHKRFDKLLAFQ